MAALNPELTAIARASIEQSRAEGLDDADCVLMATGELNTYCREHGIIGDELTPEVNAAKMALVLQIMKEPQEPAMRLCRYCGQYHPVSAGEWYCPLDRNKLQ